MMMINKPMFMNYFEDGNLLQHDKDKETFVLSKTDILGNFCLNQEEMEKLCKFIEMANDKSKVKAKLNGTILEVKIDEPKLKANINTLSIDNKPQLDLSEVISSFTINVDKLKIASAFSDKKGVRAVLNGVCVRNGWIMATDSFSAYKTPCEDTSVNLVINNSFINILKELKGNIKLETDGMKIWHKNENGLTYVGRLLKECNELPQILLMENVPMVHSSENIKDFEKWLLFLESLGYKNYWKDLNAKNYGIPQNRDRCYMISLLNSNCDYTFPQPIKLKLRLKDMLEEKVDDKYFLSDKMIKYLTNPLAMNGGRKKVFMRNFDTNKEIASTITCAAGNRPPDNYILVKEATQKGYVEAYEGDEIYIDRPHQKRGVVQKNMIQTIKCNCNDVGVVALGNYSPSGHNASRIVDNSGIAPTVMENHGTVTATVDKNLWSQSQMKMITNDGNVKRYINSDIVDEFKEGQAADISFPNGYNKAKRVHNECPAINGTTTESSFIVKNDLRIRKLTPKECWRLMGFSDDDFDKAEKINSNTQLYKQAGNSIVVNVLMAIFKQFFN